jgi:hypothetical protein
MSLVHNGRRGMVGPILKLTVHNFRKATTSLSYFRVEKHLREALSTHLFHIRRYELKIPSLYGSGRENYKATRRIAPPPPNGSGRVAVRPK